MFYIDYNWQLILINLFIYIVCIYIAKPQITFISPQLNNKNNGVNTFFILLTISSVFAFWSADTYHSWEQFIIASQIANYDYWQYEEVYNKLGDLCGNNYFLWRACIWLPACLFMYYTAKVLNLQNRNLLIAFLLFGFFLSFTRGMLGHAMMLFGAVLAFDKSKVKHRKVLGIIIICASYFFHKSMYLNIIFAVLALYPFGKKSIILSLLLFPFLTIIASYLIKDISSGVLDVSLGEATGGVGDRTTLYASGEKSVANIMGVIYSLKTMLPEYLALFYLYKKVIINKLFPQNNIFIYLFRLTYVCFYIASLFYFVDTSDAIYSRLKYMGLFPMVFLFGKILSMESRIVALIKFIIIFQIFSHLYNMVYNMYRW